ncbi:MAG: DUF3048 domain-containing protein [Propionibacteriaceae bacterium]|nr:DUF3048 domain-containing protein [Propionibacteriaceae bacterium]
MGLVPLAACTASPAPQAPTPPVVPRPSVPPAPSATPTPTAPPTPVWPLTGLPAPDAASLAHPAVVAKVSNMRESQPQAGIELADLVVVEPNGINYTRLAAVFHSQLPERVGPIRSLREGDSKLFGPMKPAMASYGAAQWVLDIIDGNPNIDNRAVTSAGAASAYQRDNRRARPDNAFVDLPVLLQGARAGDAPPALFGYAASPEGASAMLASETGAETATGLRVAYGSGSYAFDYSWDAASATYLRGTPWGGAHIAESGVRVAPTNVVVLRIAWSLVDEGGVERTSPVLHITNTSGDLYALTGGRVVRGTWHKGGVNDPFEFTTDSGEPLLLAPGQTYVELPRADMEVTITP